MCASVVHTRLSTQARVLDLSVMTTVAASQQPLDVAFMAAFVVFYLLALIGWVCVCVEENEYLVNVMFCMAVSLVIEIELLSASKTLSAVHADIVIMIVIFGLLLIVSIFILRIAMITAMCVYFAILAIKWINVLSAQIIVPLVILVVMLILIKLSFGGVGKFCYAVIFSLIVSWVLEYGSLFVVNRGERDYIIDASNDLLTLPVCVTQWQCAYRVTALLLLTGVRLCLMVPRVCCAKEKGCCSSCSCCWTAPVTDSEIRDLLDTRDTLIAARPTRHRKTNSQNLT